MEEQNAHYRKMTETPVTKLVLTLAIPTTISMLVTNIYNMADTYFVGTVGTSASGAVGIVFALMFIIQAFGFMIGQGAGSIISRKLGEQDVECATVFASTGFFLSLVMSTILAALGLLFLTPLMRLLGSTETILPYARTYGTYILAVAPFMMSSFILNNILRYEGHASLAMVGLTTGSLLNIFGDWYLIRVLHMGVAGAGLSTALSQVVSFVILLSVFLRGKTQAKLRVSKISRDFGDVYLILRTGFPSFLRQGLGSVSTMVLNTQAGFYRDAAVAAMSIVNRICSFIFSVALGIGQGFQPVSAFNYGAKKYERVRKAFYATLSASEICMGVLAVAGLFLSSDLIGIFRDDPAVVEIGTLALRLELVALFFLPLGICTNMMLQSVGRHVPASFLSTLRSGLLLIPAVVILSERFGVFGVQLAPALADVLTFFLSIPFAAHFLRELNPKQV